MTCETCKWWEKAPEGCGWDNFGDCHNPLFHLYSRDESGRLGGRYDRMSNINETAFGKDFGCIKWEAK